MLVRTKLVNFQEQLSDGLSTRMLHDRERMAGKGKQESEKSVAKLGRNVEKLAKLQVAWACSLYASLRSPAFDYFYFG